MLACCIPPGYEPISNTYFTKLVQILRVILVTQVAFGVLEVITEWQTGILMIIGALILYCLTKSYNWCMALFYIFLSLVETFSGVLYIGEYFAICLNGGYPELTIEKAGLIMLKVPFYTVSMFYAFLSYKEFKAVSIEYGVNAGLEMPRMPNNNPPRNNYAGEGHRIN